LSGDDTLPITGELTAIARAVSALRRALKRPTKVEILRYREAMREAIRQRLEWPERDASPEIIVVRLSRADDYPNTDAWTFGLFRASPWFKFEVKRITDRDLEVFMRIENVVIRKRKARRAKLHTPESGARKVWVVGRIPLERISHIDWEPESAYGLPRFFVSYGWGGPFREVALFEESGRGSHSARRELILYELHDVKYQGEGGTPWRWIKWTASRLKFQLDDRRQVRRDRDEFPP
jgi:hypothetical protein